jgi:hypothetical protein
MHSFHYISHTGGYFTASRPACAWPSVASPGADFVKKITKSGKKIPDLFGRGTVPAMGQS